MISPCMHICDNKTLSGYCQTTACINPKFSNIGTAQYGQGVQKRIISNADRIRAMSDEELAEWFKKHCCPFELSGADKWECEHNCGKCWLDWLKQGAT